IAVKQRHSLDVLNALARHHNEGKNRFITGEAAAIKNNSKSTAIQLMKTRVQVIRINEVIEDEMTQLKDLALPYLTHSLLLQEEAAMWVLEHSGMENVSTPEEATCQREINLQFKRGLDILFHPYLPNDIKELIRKYI